MKIKRKKQRITVSNRIRKRRFLRRLVHQKLKKLELELELELEPELEVVWDEYDSNGNPNWDEYK